MTGYGLESNVGTFFKSLNYGRLPAWRRSVDMDVDGWHSPGSYS